MTDPMTRLAREIEGVKKAQRDKGSTPQLGRSSIENGKIEEYDAAGQLKQVIGKQPDGTNTTTQVNGPIPPTPTAPMVEAFPLALAVSWDGLWVDGAVAPLDLKRIDVHLTPSAGTNPLTTPAVATIAAAGWGDARLPVGAGTYFVSLVAWTTSGKWATSAPSGPIEVEQPPEPVLSDGNPPSIAPRIELVPAFDAIQVLIAPPPNADPIIAYTVYVNGEAAIKSDASPIAVALDGDGVRLPFDADSSITATAWDADGEGPPSAARLGRPKRLHGNDILQGTVGTPQISDYAVVVQKLKSTNHHIF